MSAGRSAEALFRNSWRRALLFLWRLPLAQPDFRADGQFFIFLDNVQHHAFGILILHLLCQDAPFFRAITPVLRVVDAGHSAPPARRAATLPKSLFGPRLSSVQDSLRSKTLFGPPYHLFQADRQHE